MTTASWHFDQRDRLRLRFLRWMVARGRITDWPERTPRGAVLVGPQRRHGASAKKGPADVRGREVR